MIIFPNCKINLGLRILRKRNDAFHDLETVFCPLPLKDAIEVVSNAENKSAEIEFSQSGIDIGTKQEDNLCIKAYNLLKNDFPQLLPVKMHLHKAIPIGSGLGGGSADGASTLLLLNKKYNLKLSTGQLIDYALRIGSDCPFFIINKPCFATSRGEFLEKVKLDLSAYKIVLINPGIHISTSWAFTQIIPAQPQKSIKEIINQPVETWKDELVNDFEEHVFKKYTEIKKIKQQLYEDGGIYSSLSGSGSVVYGIFKKETPIKTSFPRNYFIKELVS